MTPKFKSIIAFTMIFFSIKTFGQSLAGVTGKPDTSYSNYSAFKSTVKSHPEISLVPEIRSSKIRETKGLVYSGQPQRKLMMDVFEPALKSSGKRTAVMIIHGGGWRSGNRTQHYPLAQHLALLGYTCFTPEYRLSTEALYPAAVYDLKAALRWIRTNSKKYNLDSTKIAVLGFSAGGELAAFLGTTNGNVQYEGSTEKKPATVKAVIDIDGTLSFVHPESGEGDDTRSTSAATYWFGYSKKENLSLWEEASPLHHAGQTTPPTLFLNSSVDRMHAGREDYISILRKHGIYTETHAFEGAPHSFCLFDPWFQPTVQYIDTFLKKVFH